ncbi:hypothetical protein H6G97_45040 [Nostoc flagelliforme FACHB-838]|uniref:Uncharacterized protein n=1 Tax=Nostoc flagelliforme FACHB-838 TaxID=2692904 RepID=A0ABR8E3F9_9NOSO|nr:hypothetical protein [Nostoc flagelliforme]MBD2536104.1 hypothetical protein [Nostoc flagelliforme FACHB-838]
MNPQILQIAINSATNARVELHQGIYKLRHGSGNEVEQLLARQKAVMATTIAPQIHLGFSTRQASLCRFRCHGHFIHRNVETMLKPTKQQGWLPQMQIYI